MTENTVDTKSGTALRKQLTGLPILAGYRRKVRNWAYAPKSSKEKDLLIDDLALALLHAEQNRKQLKAIHSEHLKRRSKKIDYHRNLRYHVIRNAKARKKKLSADKRRLSKAVRDRAKTILNKEKHLKAHRIEKAVLKRKIAWRVDYTKKLRAEIARLKEELKKRPVIIKEKVIPPPKPQIIVKDRFDKELGVTDYRIYRINILTTMFLRKKKMRRPILDLLLFLFVKKDTGIMKASLRSIYSETTINTLIETGFVGQNSVGNAVQLFIKPSGEEVIETYQRYIRTKRI